MFTIDFRQMLRIQDKQTMKFLNSFNKFLLTFNTFSFQFSE